jgi:catechol 2,3-dioxygenase-like lactoylglutathione lyase family enzyme
MKVAGIGGVFFKGSANLNKWYKEKLGINYTFDAGGEFYWREDKNPEKRAMTVFSIFEPDSNYFGRKEQSFMLNFRVNDLEEMLSWLHEQGVDVVRQKEESAYGKFAWIEDPAGNRIELWEPPSDNPNSF